MSALGLESRPNVLGGAMQTGEGILTPLNGHFVAFSPLHWYLSRLMSACLAIPLGEAQSVSPFLP